MKKDSFKLRARLDRVEKRGERTAIIDYKTSANKNFLTIRYHRLDLKDRDSWSEAIGTLQLPFYLLTYSTLTGEKPEEIDCLFLLLGKARIDSDIEVPLFKDEIRIQGELWESDPGHFQPPGRNRQSGSALPAYDRSEE